VYKRKTAPPAEIETAVLEKTEQLIPLKDAIATRLTQLLNAEIYVNNKWLKLLDESLVMLPREAFATMPDREVTQLLDALASHRGWHDFVPLFVRMADAGARTLSFYEGQLSEMQNIWGLLVAPALAICRIGEASEQTRAILRKKFIESSKSDRFDVTYNSAMFVTLLKLRDPILVDPYPTNFKRQEVIDWYKAVRQGKGQTDIGPNNCEAWGFRYFRPLHPPFSLGRSLVYDYKNRAWIENHPR
jgi:hypothetical protein